MIYEKHPQTSWPPRVLDSGCWVVFFFFLGVGGCFWGFGWNLPGRQRGCAQNSLPPPFLGIHSLFRFVSSAIARQAQQTTDLVIRQYIREFASGNMLVFF